MRCHNPLSLLYSQPWAPSSVVERFFYTEDVGGSIPLAPTNNKSPYLGLLLLVIALGGIEPGGARVFNELAKRAIIKTDVSTAGRGDSLGAHLPFSY